MRRSGWAAGRPRSTSPTARPSARRASRVALADLAADSISAEGSFSNKKHTWSYGAQAAHVAVDPKTGQVELIDCVVVEDCGRVINPATLRGQVLGAMVQGLGGAFLEHLVYDEQGQLLTGSLADYLVPTASDFPNIRAIVAGEHPSRSIRSAPRAAARAASSRSAA